MNLNRLPASFKRHLKTFGFCLVIAMAASFCWLPAVLAGGPKPFSENQFPVWYGFSGTSTNVVATPTNLVNIPIPPNILGAGGVMRLTYSFTKAQLTNNATFITSLGGTPIRTNTLLASANDLVTTYVSLNAFQQATLNAPTNVLVIGGTTTNTFNGEVNVTSPVVSTATNGLSVIVSGQGDGTNVYGLNFFLIEALPVQ